MELKCLLEAGGQESGLEDIKAKSFQGEKANRREKYTESSNFEQEVVCRVGTGVRTL